MNRFAQFRECLLAKRKGTAHQPPLLSRLPAFVGARADLERALRSLRVVLVGVGSIGMRIAEHFARLRVAELWLVDPRNGYKPESVLTHPINRVIDQPKASYTARRCKKLSPSTRVFAHVGHVQDLWLDTFADAHLCLMATDNLAAEVEFGRRCLSLGKRLVQAALHGETLTAQIRVFANDDGHGPCPACGFGATEWRQLSDQVQFSCEGRTSGHSAPRITGPPTRSTSSLCSLAADLALNQSLRLVLRLGEPVEDSILEYCGFTNQIVTSHLERNSGCRCDHTRFTMNRAPRPLKGYFYNKLVSDFALVPGHESLSLTVGGTEWIEQGLCRCAEPRVVRRFIPSGQGHAGRCARCQSAIRPQPFYTSSAVSAPMLGKAVSTPFHLLGVRECPWVLLRTADRAFLVQDPHRTMPVP